MRETHIGRRFGARKNRNTGIRWIRIPLRGALLLVVISPVVIVSYQAFLWLRTGNWVWIEGVALLPDTAVSAMENPSSWFGLYELALSLANLPLAGVLSVFAVVVYVVSDLLGR